MAERPRSQSVMQARPPVIQSRTGRLLQKVSNFKGRIRLSSRKNKDDHDNHSPYPSQTHPFGGVKPYMSHPLLGLSGMNIEPFNPADQDGDDSSTSHSPARSEFGRPSPTTVPLSGLPQAIPPTTISAGLVRGSHIGVAITTQQRNIDGLPHTPNTALHPAASRPQPSTTTIPSQATITPQITPGVINSNSIETMRPVDSPRSTSGPKEKAKPETSSVKLGRTIIRKLSRPRLKTKSSSDQLSSSSLPSTSTPSTSVVPRPAVITYSSSLPLPLPRNVAVTPPPNPTRRDAAPRLVLPPANHRFSLTLMDGSSARLSPSVILRPPPLPIMRLPTLPTINVQPAESPAEGSSRGRVGLRSMPELPHQGSDIGDDGDDDDIHEDGDDEDDEGDEGSGIRDTGSSLSLYDDESAGRPSTSMSGSIDGGSLLPPSLSSRTKSHSRSSSYQENVFLPAVDTSRIDLSFLDHPPPDVKGKGKARSGDEEWEEADASRTPTSSAPHHDYFSRRERSTDSHTDEVHSRKDSVSPARTPRASDNLRMVLPASSHAPNPLATPSRPGMYKRASRSMIDIYAIAKKEEVEKMVREEEEAVTVERRRSLIVKDGKRESMVLDRRELSTVQDDDEALDEASSSSGTGLQRRLSKAPAYESIPHPLRRRRSMPTYTEATTPPPYPSFAPFAHPMSASVKIQPRDDEGREHLPSYSNEIYVKMIIPRKMEFTAPGTQARDRKWRRVMCVLEGTVLKIYRCPAGTGGVSAIGEWWEKKVGVGDVSQPLAGSSSATPATANAEAPRATEGIPKSGEQGGGDVTELRVDPPTRSPTPTTASRSQSSFSTQQPSATRSRLNLAVQLLKPSRPHGRSNSDAIVPVPISQTSRPSLNVPRPMHSNSSRSRVNSRPSTANGRFSSAAPSSASGNGMTVSVPSSASSQQFGSEASSNTSSPSRSQFHSDKGGIPDPDPADLIRAYTMQNAESGLGNDYIKRKNVIRVRVEGEQFLLQAKDIAGVVEWIEALQASANVALDLDERLMPKGPLFPRRRRRRGARRPVTDTTGSTRLSIDHGATLANAPASTLAAYE